MEEEEDGILQTVVSERIEILEDKASNNWKELQSAIPYLRNYKNYKEFSEEFKLFGSCRARKKFLLSFAGVKVFSKNINCLLILLFNAELQKLAYCARTPTIREDAWGIIVAEFLGVLPSLQRKKPEIKVFLKNVRSKATAAMRKAAAKRKRRTTEAFYGWQEAIYEKGYGDKQMDEIIYSEILDVLQSGLQPVEFDALMQRIRLEYYRREKTPDSGLKEERNIAVERRAVRKARILIKNYLTECN